MSQLTSPLVGIWKLCYSGEGCSFGWIFRVVFLFPVKYSCLQNKKELNTTTYDAPKWREKRNRRQEKKAGLTKLTKVFPLIHSQTATKSSKKRLTILNCKCKISAPLSYLVASFVQVICLIIWRRFSTRWFAKRFWFRCSNHIFLLFILRKVKYFLNSFDNRLTET